MFVSKSDLIKLIFVLVCFWPAFSPELLREQVLVNSNQSVILKCTHNLTNVTNVRWSYVTHGTNKKEYLYDLVQQSIHKDVKVYCNLGEPICNIEIIRVSQKFAGKYLCEVRSGREELKPTSIINLVVGDLECSPSGKMQISEFKIGETDCDGIVPEEFSRSCSFLFKGELSQLPIFKWIGWQSKEILITELKSEQLRTGQITASSNIPASSHMDGVTFECLLENQSNIQSCIFPKYSIQYLRNTTEKHLTMNMNDLKTVECSTNKSDEVSCTYSWIHKVDEVDVEIHSSLVTPKQMTSEGTYTCIAKCQFYNQQECTIRALEVIVKSTNSNLVITLVVVTAFLFLVILIGTVVVRKLKQRGKKEQDSESSLTYAENSSNKLM